MNDKNIKEQFVLRASTAIVKETKKGIDLLVISDGQKNPEVSAGYDRWSRLQQHIWSVPGGTRVFDSGKPKSREEVLHDSLLRETGFNVTLQELSQGRIQDYPFLLGRQKPGIIEQVATTSSLFYIGQLAREYQRYIEKKIREEKALWYPLKDIAQEFIALKDRGRKLEFRQHVYTMAYLWYLPLVQKWSNEAILREVNRLNNSTGVFVGDESHRQDLELGLTIFGPKYHNVTTPYMLPDDVKQFLYDIPKPE